MFALLSPSDEEEEDTPKIEEGSQPSEALPWPRVPSLLSMCKTALTANLNALSGLTSLPSQLLSEIIGGLAFPLSLSELRALPSGSIHSGVVLGPRSCDQSMQSVTRQPISRLSILKNNALGVSYLRELPELRDLRLTGCPKLAQGLVQRTADFPRSPALAKLSLHTLHLVDCSLSDALLTELVGFAHLLPTLRSLDVSANGELTNESLANLALYPNLTALNVSGTQFSAVEVVLSLEQLREFSCGFTLMGDTEVELLVGIARLQSQLTSLSLECTTITDVALRHLEALTSLRSLNLSGNKLSSHSASSLTHLSNLESLSLAGTDLLTLPDWSETRGFAPTFLSKLPFLRSLDARETCGVFLPEVLRITTLNLAQVTLPTLEAQVRWLEQGPNHAIHERKKSEKNEEVKQESKQEYVALMGSCSHCVLRQSSASDGFLASKFSLSFLAHVATLDLSHTQVTDNVWLSLRQLRALTTLDVSDTSIGHSCKRCVVGKLVPCPFGVISQLLPLTSLVLSNTQVTPLHLLLHFPPSLTCLDLRRNPLAWDGEMAQLHSRLTSLQLDPGVQPIEQTVKTVWALPSPVLTSLPPPDEGYCGRVLCWQRKPCSLHQNTGLQFTRQELLRVRYLPQCVRFPLGLSFIQGVTRSRHDPVLDPSL